MNKPDQIYNYGFAFTAERTGRSINMYENLIWKDRIIFDTELEAMEQMKIWEELGQKIDKMKI